MCLYSSRAKQTQCHTGVDSIPLPGTLKNLQAKIFFGPTQTLFCSLVSTINSHLHPTTVIILHDPHQTTVDWSVPHMPTVFPSFNMASLPTPPPILDGTEKPAKDNSAHSPELLSLFHTQSLYLMLLADLPSSASNFAPSNAFSALLPG